MSTAHFRGHEEGLGDGVCKKVRVEPLGSVNAAKLSVLRPYLPLPSPTPDATKLPLKVTAKSQSEDKSAESRTPESCLGSFEPKVLLQLWYTSCLGGFRRSVCK